MSASRIRRSCTAFLLLSAIAFAFACDGDGPSAPPDPSVAMTTSTVAGGGGLDLAVYEAGNPNGRPIVFIHGFTGSALSWQPQFAQSLAAEFRLVTYDLRGHGASDKPLDPPLYTTSDLWADDLNAVIESKNLVDPIVVGWSYGGYVIADYLRKYGHGDLGGLVFVGAVTKQGSAEAAAFLTDEVLALFPAILSTDAGQAIEGTRSLTRMFGYPELTGTAFENSLASAMMVPQPVRLAMFSRTLDNDDVLGFINVPTLVIQGDRDALVRLSAAEHIALTIPGAELMRYGDVGHAPHLEVPSRFNRDLAEFVRFVP